MRLLFACFSVLLVCACRQQPVIRCLPMEGFALVDTGYVPTERREPDKVMGYPIYYIGPPRDTIHIGGCYSLFRTAKPRWPARFACSRAVSDRNFVIHVDTKQESDVPWEYLNDDGTINRDSTRHYRSLVFTLQNISDSIHWIGQSYCVEFIQREYRDRKGNWVRPGKSLGEVGICGTGQPFIYLRPGELILGKTRMCKGDFATDCRLVFGYGDQFVYSNAFRDSIYEKMLL